MQIVLVLETRASCKSDFMYIKSALDYYYYERSYTLTKIYAKNKSSLMSQGTIINQKINKYDGESIVIICSDYDHNDSILNDNLIIYCKKNNYDLVWMNVDVEDVFLGKSVSKKDKKDASINFLKKKTHLLPHIDKLGIDNPIAKRPASNLLCVFDKYLKRKT